MKPHKWAKEIKAWADGAEIEFRFYSEGKWSNWEVVTPPRFVDDEIYEYRIKPQEPHEVSEQYGKAMQQAYEDGFVQGKIYAETGRVSDGATIPKEPQYLYAWENQSTGEFRLGENEPHPLREYVSQWKCIGKIKLETDDDTRS